MAADGGFSSQLQRDGGNLRGLLERSGRQSGSQRVGRIGECPLQRVTRVWFVWPPADFLSSPCVPGVCTRPAEIVLLCVGKPWTDHECVHSQMTVPACPAYCSRSRLWPRPTHRQEAGSGNRKKAPDTAGPDTRLNGRDGRERSPPPPSICVDSTRDAEGTRWKIKIKKKKKN